MKPNIHRLFVAGLIASILMWLPTHSVGQTKVLGDLQITKTATDGFVLLNGENVVTGRSVVSPSSIVTSSHARAKVLIAQTGTVSMAPGSKIDLSFLGSSISGDYLGGEVTIETLPGTSLRFLTPFGDLTVSNPNQVNIIVISTSNNNSFIHTRLGEAKINNVAVTAGKYYPEKPDAAATAQTPKSGGFNPILIVAIVGGVGAAVLLALSGSGNNDTQVVSPIR